jgi:hypothetical protein
MTSTIGLKTDGLTKAFIIEKASIISFHFMKLNINKNLAALWFSNNRKSTLDDRRTTFEGKNTQKFTIGSFMPYTSPILYCVQRHKCFSYFYFHVSQSELKEVKELSDIFEVGFCLFYKHNIKEFRLVKYLDFSIKISLLQTADVHVDTFLILLAHSISLIAY